MATIGGREWDGVAERARAADGLRTPASVTPHRQPGPLPRGCVLIRRSFVTARRVRESKEDGAGRGRCTRARGAARAPGRSLAMPVVIRIYACLWLSPHELLGQG